MSASMMPTSRPRSRRARARLTESDDLPTPPLPDATAITRVRGSTERPLVTGFAPPVSRVFRSLRCCSLMCEKRTSTRPIPDTVPAWWRTWPSRFCFSGQPGTVSTISITTSLPLIATSPSIPSSTTSRRSSGSMTPRMASRIASSVGALMPASYRRCVQRSVAGSIVERVEHETVEQLREEVGRLLRHRLARGGDGLDLGDRRRAQQQGDRGALGLGGYRLGGLDGTPAVADAVGDRDG